jgi:hypothetical protein
LGVYTWYDVADLQEAIKGQKGALDAAIARCGTGVPPEQQGEWAYLTASIGDFVSVPTGVLDDHGKYRTAGQAMDDGKAIALRMNQFAESMRGWGCQNVPPSIVIPAGTDVNVPEILPDGTLDNLGAKLGPLFSGLGNLLLPLLVIAALALTGTDSRTASAFD